MSNINREFTHQAVPIMQLIFLSHFLQHNSLWSLSPNEEMQVWMFETEFWDDPTKKVDTFKHNKK